MKKMYMVEWYCSWGIPHSDVIKANDMADAWSKIKRKHPFASRNAHRISIDEIE